MKRSPALLTAVDVARLCRVDLKTIHNWTEKGKLVGARTAGRHLRFRRLDVITFLRAYAHPVPPSLLAPRARICIIGDAAAPGPARRALGRRFDIIAVAEPIDALVSLAETDPDVVVIDDAPWVHESHAIERLGAVAATRHIRVVITTDDADRREIAMRAGAAASVPHDGTSLRDALERIALGVA